MEKHSTNQEQKKKLPQLVNKLKLINLTMLQDMSTYKNQGFFTLTMSNL